MPTSSYPVCSQPAAHWPHLFYSPLCPHFSRGPGLLAVSQTRQTNPALGPLLHLHPVPEGSLSATCKATPTLLSSATFTVKPALPCLMLSLSPNPSTPASLSCFTFFFSHNTYHFRLYYIICSFIRLIINPPPHTL